MEKFSLNLLNVYVPVYYWVRGMSEVKPIDLPIPLVNYVYLIKKGKTPYYDIVKYLLQDMEVRYRKANGVSEIIYTINPRQLQKEIEEKIKSEKVTTINICRTILALVYGCNLKPEKDFYVTTSSRGRRNYHIRITSQTLQVLRRFV